MTPTEKRIIALTMASHALVHFYEQTFPPVLKLVEAEYHLGLTGAGGLGNIFPLFFGLGALPAGMVVDKWGSRRTLIAYLTLCAAAAIITMFTHNIWLLAVMLGVMGIAAGLYHPAGVTLISHNVRQTGSALGFHGVGGNLGLALAPMFAAAVAASLGWRAAYAVLAIPSALLAFYFLVHRDFGENKCGPHTVESDEDCAGNNALVNDQSETLWGPLVLLFILGVLNGFCYRGMLTFLPTFFSGGSTDQGEILAGGMLTTAVIIIGVVGQFVGGKLADRFRAEVVYAACFTVSMPFLVTLSMFAPGYAAVSGGVFAFFYFASQPVGNTIVTRLSSTAFRGRAYGIFFFMNFGMGSFAASVSGWVGEKYGVSAIFPFLGVVLALVAVMGWVLVASLKKRSES